MTETPDDKTPHVVPPPLPSVEPSPVPGAPLQFDTAEFGQPAVMGCSSCGQSITTEYYALNGATLCGTCRAAAAGEKGTPVSRALRAGFAGGAAAFAGGLLYFLVVWLFSLEIGLIAIAVGFAVGIAVKWGSYGRGGAFYQAMAMSLTYLAIVASLMAAGLVQLASGEPDKNTKPAAASTATPGAESESVVQAGSPLEGGTDASEDGPGFLIGLVMLFGLMLALPFLSGIENIIGIVIIAIGVYEAWKINKRPAVTGPHAVGASSVQAVS
jgi:hypothetical protein